MRWWPISWLSSPSIRHNGRGPKVAYVLWHYPILSETFIRREVASLRRFGIAIEVVAEAPDESMLPNSEPIENAVTYLEPINRADQRRCAMAFMYRNPLRFANLVLYVAFHCYSRYKTLRGDLDLMLKSCRLAAVLQEKGITHIHAPWADTQAFVAMIAARLMNVSYSVQVRAYELHADSFNFALPDKLLNAAFVVTNSRYNEARLKPILSGRQERLQVIYNGVDLDQFNPSQRRSGDTLKILAVGRLVEIKGFPYLLRACHILRDRGVKFQCDIIGGAQKSDINTYLLLKKLHRRLKLDDCVRFLGSQPFARVLEAYQNADIFALPCVIAAGGSRDITPNALLEAMAMRLAVISTPVGAIPEIVEDGFDGVLVPSNDERALAHALVELGQNPMLRLKLGEAARSKIQSHFDIDRNMERYAALFRGETGRHQLVGEL
jgi:colanic acid/amylovoran biosynthesis glycosyltransferase